MTVFIAVVSILTWFISLSKPRATFAVYYHLGITALAIVLLMLFFAGDFVTPKAVQLWSMIHMICATTIALTFVIRGSHQRGANKESEKLVFDFVFYGDRISLLGYLHTLIGISAALFFAVGGAEELAGNPGQFMQSLLAPTSSALLTSLIGWWIGAVIKGKAREKSSQGEVTAKSPPPLPAGVTAGVIDLLNDKVTEEQVENAQTLRSSLDLARKEAKETCEIIKDLNHSLRESAKLLSGSCTDLRDALRILDEAYRRLGLSADGEAKRASLEQDGEKNQKAE